MDINVIKLKMITEYQKQFNKLFDKYWDNELELNSLIYNINSLNRRYNFLRADIKNYGNSSNDIKLLEYGKDIYVSKPDWFKNELGIGCQLECRQNNFSSIFKCINSGNLKVSIRGVDFRDIDNIRIPIYINFTKLMINGHVVFDRNYLVWHDEPYVFEKSCKNLQCVAIDLKFKTLFDYFPSLYFQISEYISADELIRVYNEVSEYINAMLLLLNKKVI